MTTDSGALDRAWVSPGTWLVPATVGLQRTEAGIPYLHWKHDADDPTYFADAGEGFLENFVELEEATDEEIAVFAERWGVLLICEHGFPSTHAPAPWPFNSDAVVPLFDDGTAADLEMPRGCRPLSSPDGGNMEPMGVWRILSRQFKAALDVAARLHWGEKGPQGAWQHLGGPPAPIGTDDGVETEKLYLGAFVENMLQMGDVRIGFSWADNVSEVDLVAPSMFSALAMQLALAVSRSDGLAICSNCARPFIPSRRPKPSQRRYCAICTRDKVPVRDASRAYRARKRQEKP